ncbi:helix-turn-helix domain-containing protein [Ancylobacter pratisalsi]|uniref:Chromosomal replication initiator DnaA n=1 Tax=Ancylobacter pratisalsi TaxID=1745854 RepID=A0A6P1YTR9_9HYPH|nr:helix-turn-helix domain-containing protein [Ancylobacter pratisalsi]QIB35074.1 chromosomal replication initiator DnaA [Ancylobacter pratisalsi]
MDTQTLPTAPELCRLAARLVADEAGVPFHAVLNRCRLSHAVSTTRALAMYLAHVGLGLSMSAVARGFGRHRSTVAHACRRMEEYRETPGWDLKMAALENRISQTLAGEVLHVA